jgi:hypothetical protein
MGTHLARSLFDLLLSDEPARCVTGRTVRFHRDVHAPQGRDVGMSFSLHLLGVKKKKKKRGWLFEDFAIW